MKSLKIDGKIRRALHEDLVAWHRKHQRDLPWRRNRDPYAVTVSEFMLQQTQVSTVIPYFERWMKQFPSWNKLAQADEKMVLKAWEGLGYYTRARNLHRLAQWVDQQGNGELPHNLDRLQELPGVGAYTAGAIASFALKLRAPLLDGNVIRVFSRLLAYSEDVTTGPARKALWEIAQELLPEKDFADYNEGLMELGALVCTPRNPQCLICPLQPACRAPNPENFPVKTKRVIERKEETIALIESKQRWWCVPVGEKGRLAGFWSFPYFSKETMRDKGEVTRFSYGITKYRVELTARKASWKSKPEGSGKWLSLEEIRKLPFPSAHRRLFPYL